MYFYNYLPVCDTFYLKIAKYFNMQQERESENFVFDFNFYEFESFTVFVCLKYG